MIAAIAFDPPLNGKEQVTPHRLGAEITAPDAPSHRVHQEQDYRGQDQETGDVIDLLRPYLDEEEIEAATGQIDQHRLMRCVRAAIRAHKRQEIIDSATDDQQRPLD